jgi:hypothetical protein
VVFQFGIWARCYGIIGACEGQGHLCRVARKLAEYKLYLGGVQEIRSDYAITEREGDFIFFMLNKTLKWEQDFLCATEEYQKLRE